MTGTDETLPFLMASLKDAQDTTRAYDTKAQIVGVGYIFSANVILDLGSQIGDRPELNLLTVTLAWLIVIFPIVLFGAVLYPTRKVSPRLGEKGSHAARTFYVEPEHVVDVETYLATVEANDPKKEVAYEILKTSGLREIKRRRFLRALWAAAISFVALFIGQLLRAEGLLTV
jgi:hypothetical protein